MSTQPTDSTAPDARIPYKIAVLVYVFNDAGHLLLLHRRRPPNQDLYSPIGGKLEQQTGESPYACALREIEEEIDVRLGLSDIRLLGIVSERAYTWNAATTPSTVATHDPPSLTPPPPGPAAHWLMFCFEVNRPLNFPSRSIEEARLEWIDPAALPTMSIPKTDRDVIWPLVRRHSRFLAGAAHPSEFFSVHIDCSDSDKFITTYEHPLPRH